MDWLEIVSEELADYRVEFDELEGVTERQTVWALSTSGTSGKAKGFLDKIAAGDFWGSKDEGKEVFTSLKQLWSDIQSVDSKYLPFPYDAVEWRRS